MTKINLCAIVSAAYFALLPSVWAQFSYNLADLGEISGAALNDSGQVAGFTESGEPFLSGPNGIGIQPIGPFPPGTTTSYFTGLNNAGQVSGFLFSGSEPAHPFITGPNGSAPRDLGFIGLANDVNNRGQVTGFAFGRRSAFLSNEEGESLKFLGALPGEGRRRSEGQAVNDLGQIGGTSKAGSDPQHAFLSEPNGGPLKDLGNFGGNFLGVTDVNNLGQVVGVASLPGDSVSHAFVSAPGGGALTDLGTLLGQNGTFSEANAINDAGVVVGSSDAEVHNDNGFLTHAFVYTSGGGMLDLNSLINPALGFELARAFDINAQGQILASGLLGEFGHTLILTPTNVPGVPDAGSTALLLGCALAGLPLFALGRSPHACVSQANYVIELRSEIFRNPG